MDYHTLTYREETTIKIPFESIINHLNIEMPEVVINNYIENSFKIYIPFNSINYVQYSCSVTNNCYCFHDVVLHYPCSIDDFKIFNCITKYFQNQFQKDASFFNYVMHWHYEKYFYSKIVALLRSSNIEVAWQNLMNSVFKENKNEYPFWASNSILYFKLSANFLGVNTEDRNFNKNLSDATLKYISENYFLDVNTNSQFITIKHQNNKIKDLFIQGIFWNNKKTQLFKVHNYLIVKINEEWVAVKPKKWLPIILPYLQQFDTCNAQQLMPVLNDDLYNQLIAELSLVAVNLKFSCIEKENQQAWSASVVH